MTGITFISSSEAFTLRLLKTDEYNKNILCIQYNSYCSLGMSQMHCVSSTPQQSLALNEPGEGKK
jgi:hypothetical protein